MAEKPEDQATIDDKISKAKEFYALGCRNYYVKCFTESADDLSEACKLYGEVYGVDGDELGEVYLLYAKALIAVGQDENKLIEVPENEDEDEPAEESDDDTNEEDPANGNSPKDTNGTEKVENEPQAGPSTSNDKENENSDGDQAHDDDSPADEDGGNLEVAWEVLQNAALIFQRQEDNGLKNLLEVYNEMAGISMENGNFTLAVDDFTRALSTFDCIEESDKNYRIAAEIHYKLGLCLSMEKSYDEAIKSFQKAHDIISDVIEIERSKGETEDIISNIKDMEETQQEIMNKITEIGDIKADEIEQVKRELAKLYGMNGASSSSSSADQPCSSSSVKATPKVVESDKPKPMDISHLIKRKKPDISETTVECSPAKKQIIETSEAITAVPVDTKEKIIEEPLNVQPAVDN
ncbi:unnamed protein product [Chironomus riparius]|uniref:Tetratricopeptide SHNi-TPR domain-containing protein n=1 Tax=Chironomus riparius TaxID=315576 RepID=A0A9N9WVU2_9DIPT|nr:unnamed protein product [Chironomus riparius]